MSEGPNTGTAPRPGETGYTDAPAHGSSIGAYLHRTVTTVPGRIFGLICAMYFITYVDRVNISTLAPLMAADLHLSNVQLGLALSAFGYPYALLQILGGSVADRMGARKTLIVCGIIWGVATVLTGMAGGLFSLIVIRVLLGIGEGATFPAATRAVTSWVPSGHRGYAQGMMRSSSRLANAVTPPLTVMVALWLGWRGAFVALGCVSLGWTLAWALMFRDRPAEHPGITPADLEELPVIEKSSVASRLRDVPWGMLVRKMMPATAIYFCYNWTLWLYITWLPSFFVQAYGLNLSHTAFFSFGVFTAGVAGDTCGGLFTDHLFRRHGNLPQARRQVIITSMIGSMLCLLPALFIHNLTVIGLALGLAFFFLELTVGPIWAIPMDMAPQYAGTGSGIMNTGSAVAGILSPFAFGLIIQLSHSYSLPFYGPAILLLVGAVLAFHFLPSAPPDDRQRPDEPVPVSVGGLREAHGH
ncbi:MFS transporter [Acetobacter musti]|uniref:MFS transporter n=1 Tax=Acetobacter musti TaxID=864732 RepID=A0ABX0JP04_9PROT|nr:MFS transporter [Acetobacter musti]NHN84522.1 MFS transporter [Acetobacter musti]